MLKGTLIRNVYIPTGTYGILSVGGLVVNTAECPWLQNKKSLSCIPEGIYTIKKHLSPTKGKCFSIVGKSVKLVPDSSNSRFSCLIHTANFPDELRGCIAPGDKFTIINFGGRSFPQNLGVSNSSKTLGKMLDVLPDEWELEIKSANSPFVEPS